MRQACHNAWWRPACTGQVCAVGVLLLSPPVLRAQEPGGDLEQIIVTGSRIARPDFVSASPIISVTSDAFVRTGSTSVDSVVNQLPQFVPDATSTSNNPSNGGQGNVQLRGLGTTATLVLLDGRRLVPANGNGVVDVNVIPASLVESVEVITGGASAVYGSDAMAGVVNFKLKDEFNGVQFDGGWSQTERGDGSEYSAGLTAGLAFAEGRGEVYGYLGYTERAAIFQRARDFSAVSLGYVPDVGFLPNGSPTIAEGRTGVGPSQRPSQAAVDALFASYGYAPGTVPVVGNAFTANADGTVFSTGNGTPDSVVNFRGEQDPLLANDRSYTYNFGPWNYLQLPMERVSAFARVTFDAGPRAELFGDALYADYAADTALAPTPAQPIFLPITNPYIPPDLKFLLDSRRDPTSDVQISKRFTELGPRISSNEHQAYQFTVGSRGKTFADWTYEAYVQIAAHDATDSQQGNLLRSRVQELTYAPDGGVSICGGLRLFGPDSVSPECAEYVSAGGTNRSGYDQTIAEVSMTGSVMSLPAGELKLALGVMHKRDEFFYEADPIGSVILDDGIEDIQGFLASDDIEGSDNNTDVYVEAAFPLLRDAPGAYRLEAVFGYRHSQYESAGGADAYKAELMYDPVPMLTVRSSFQHAVRAPSVFELFAPHLPFFYDAFGEFGGVLDPCTAASPERTGPHAAQVEALCLAQGVPAALLPEFLDSDGVHPGYYGGNTDLDTETADTLTAGVVVRSWSERPALEFLQLSLDWYRIDLSDSINFANADRYVPQCFDARTNPDFDPDYARCRWFSRDAATGELTDLADVFQNMGDLEMSGVDVQLDWSIQAGPGKVGINLLASWIDHVEGREVAGLPMVDDVGHIGGAFLGSALPEWKWNLDLSYAWSGWSVSGRWRYIDSMHDREFEDFIVPSQDYFDLFGTVEIDEGLLDGLTLRAGVENLTDQDPPIFPTWTAANTEPSQYDVLGRRYYLNLTYRF
jgi:iron complex outermembrane receptor protein